MQLLSKRYKTSVFGCVFWITTSHSLVGDHQHYEKAADFSIKVAKLEDNNPELNVHGSVHRKNILIYIHQDATLHSLFYLETALHVFRAVPPPIIRSANNCIHSIWYLSHRYCYLPL